MTALYAKLKDYLIRVDDDITCKTCQSGLRSLIKQWFFWTSKALTSKAPGGDEDDDSRFNRNNGMRHD